MTLKRLLADSYLDVLISLKEKWEKTKAATDYEARLREVMAIIDFLKEIMNNNLLASDASSDERVPSGMDDTGDRTKRAGGQFEDGEFDVEE
ncbi:hypothetical protein F2Q70_00013191 [Brassica cretica]|uniref:Uncharacterized protein n=1 Tax=Brassica cretica TaxID=69181 RepID=A0A8S9M707_BRACR|nr:hypothetical protein F2Q70_00013191 [Brassica cretica]